MFTDEALSVNYILEFLLLFMVNWLNINFRKQY